MRFLRRGSCGERGRDPDALLSCLVNVPGGSRRYDAPLLMCGTSRECAFASPIPRGGAARPWRSRGSVAGAWDDWALGRRPGRCDLDHAAWVWAPGRCESSARIRGVEHRTRGLWCPGRQLGVDRAPWRRPARGNSRRRARLALCGCALRGDGSLGPGTEAWDQSGDAAGATQGSRSAQLSAESRRCDAAPAAIKWSVGAVSTPILAPQLTTPRSLGAGCALGDVILSGRCPDRPLGAAH